MKWSIQKTGYMIHAILEKGKKEEEMSQQS